MREPRRHWIDRAGLRWKIYLARTLFYGNLASWVALVAARTYDRLFALAFAGAIAVCAALWAWIPFVRCPECDEWIALWQIKRGVSTKRLGALEACPECGGQANSKRAGGG